MLFCRLKKGLTPKSHTLCIVITCLDPEFSLSDFSSAIKVIFCGCKFGTTISFVFGLVLLVLVLVVNERNLI